jgi:hypothetical protein
MHRKLRGTDCAVFKHLYIQEAVAVTDHLHHFDYIYPEKGGLGRLQQLHAPQCVCVRAC